MHVQLHVLTVVLSVITPHSSSTDEASEPLDMPVWLTIATIATDMFVLMMYALAIPRKSMNVTKCLVPNHPKHPATINGID